MSERRRSAPDSGSALEKELQRRLESKPLLLMAHAVAGYPSLDANRHMLDAMAEVGVDLVELQLPFSEPIADGPAFIKASQEAIGAGLRRDAYFDLVAWAAAKAAFPVLFMGYYNSVYRLGDVAFCERLARAGAKGFIVADLPPEEGRPLIERAKASGLDPVLIAAPTSSPERLAEIGKLASGFVYCVARKGVTGRHTELSDEVSGFLSRMRKATSLPLGLGFGLKTAEDVRRVRGLAEVAIVGTACLEAWEREGASGYRKFLGELVEATRA